MTDIDVITEKAHEGSTPATTAVSRTWSCVLFDLDGTMVDSAPSIVRALAATFADLGIPVPDHDDLLRYVGPPILHSFENFAGMTEAEALKALAVYRSHYDGEGSTDAAVFPGVAGLLRALREADVPVALATSKPEYLARKVLAHFDLEQCFTVICGASVDETISEKADIVALALAQLAELGVDSEHAVMVGDRVYDVEGAAANGVPTILVEWGYGSPDEAHDAIAVVHSIDRLRQLLLG